MSKKGAIAHDVKPDGLGGMMCAKGHCLVYADKIEIGPRIGTRVTWRHMEQHPVCEKFDFRMLPGR